MKLSTFLFFELLSVTAQAGLLDHNVVSEQHALRSLDAVIFRKYEVGDDLSLVDTILLDCKDFICWVAVRSGSKTAVGVVEINIPYEDTPEFLKTEIDAHRSQSPRVGEDKELRVLKPYPNACVYLFVAASNTAAIALYKKSGFIEIWGKQLRIVLGSGLVGTSYVFNGALDIGGFNVELS
ncbi:hypothetical protein Pmar_PMAR024241 [Perkinsus marinus ATCC 50983]|uniref:N-acetyltransferase domain-containing protein n=1 Tax=Perkinsus marinus (strain ATCC 50983 / TXsc) TaxID=423536 RepID=C5LMJ1_PERM5|nr:hypothetical protein Pmar_PMAR024241 [Perkinsus marinus ATCC 50983]EER02056.1 hypothetical protein Pmar_PMAR024241 [Perkinsus marinus ATCC 50983]|eukprot:XP_002769338.1 hypothetical protein Pmar_PMAR024241 [Perkinsus marinus ATCC 50983]